MPDIKSDVQDAAAAVKSDAAQVTGFFARQAAWTAAHPKAAELIALGFGVFSFFAGWVLGGL